MSVRLAHDDHRAISSPEEIIAEAQRGHMFILSDDENRATFGRCNNPNGHGHNYEFEVTIAGHPDPKTGLLLSIPALQESQDSMLNLLEDLHAENEARKLGEQARENQLEELRRWHAATLGREGRIGALKREVNALAARLGQSLPYATAEELERQANL